jgi:hypothetical protein
MLFRLIFTWLSTGLSGGYLGCLSTLRTQRTHDAANASRPLRWSFARSSSNKVAKRVAAVRMPYASPYSVANGWDASLRPGFGMSADSREDIIPAWISRQNLVQPGNAEMMWRQQQAPGYSVGVPPHVQHTARYSTHGCGFETRAQAWSEACG